ncbi:hypothetical protein BSKO_14056 [Bryopsis sp. KO-2023]|nr:hypothetical protein BSKO_14056 [Bryopsis sp. KO-2023]
MNASVVGRCVSTSGGGAHLKSGNASRCSRGGCRLGRDVSAAAEDCSFRSADSLPHFTPTDQFLSLEKRVSDFNQAVEVVQLPNIPNPNEGPVVGVPEHYLGVRAMLIGGIEGELIPQSVYHPERVLTGECWDTLAILPSIIPDGVMGIYGLGGGSLARICEVYYPQQKIMAWEVDPTVVELADKWMGLGFLQKHGNLTVRIGDCLSNNATVRDGFAGLVIDLFDAGGLMDQLTQKSTWETFKNRMMPRGRILANMDKFDEELCNVLLDVFEGSVSFKEEGSNVLALTGPPPNPTFAEIPSDLNSQFVGWVSIEELME